LVLQTPARRQHREAIKMSSASGRGDWRKSRWAILVGFAVVAARILIPRLTHSTTIRLVANLLILTLAIHVAIGFVHRLTQPSDDRSKDAGSDDGP